MGVDNYTGIANVCNAEFANPLQSRFIYVVELTNTIFTYGSERFVQIFLVSEQSGKHLVQNYFAGRFFHDCDRWDFFLSGTARQASDKYKCQPLNPRP